MRPHGTVIGDDLTSFVGRRREVTEVKRLLGISRLVTLIGVGGVGKTRLAFQVTRDVHRTFADGVWVVELAQVAEPALVATVVADVLGVRDQSARSLEDVLADHLRDQRLLLVLDNCEHLLDACASLAEHLLRATTHLTILATSREPLGVLAEHNWLVPPLSMPDLANTAPTRGGYAYGHEALDLFVERARAVCQDFTLDAGSRGPAAELCQRLDGLPLAIELAAVRLRALSIEQILARLEDRYRLLRTGNRGGPARHQTLRAAVDWSYDLCSAPERALWARLSVFAGGFDLDAIEAVCTDDEIRPDDTVELLAGLIDKSVVLREDRGARVRYRLLETIKAYGLEQLTAAGAAGDFRRRHRDYYLRVAEQSEAKWFGPRQVEWRERLQGEQGNLWAALNYCGTTPGEAGTGLRLVGALCYFWNACGHLKDGRYWIDRILDVDRRPTSERAKALWVNGWVAMTQGDNSAALRYFDEARDIADQLGDRAARAYAQQFRGSSEQFTGNLTAAEPLLAEAVEYHRGSGVVNSLSVLATAQLAFVSCLVGKADRAVELCDDCCQVGRTSGELWASSWALWVCGLARWTQGEYRDSGTALHLSLEAKHALNDRLGMSACVELLAWVAIETGDAQRAAQLFGVGRTLWGSIGEPLFGSATLIASHDTYLDRTRHALGGHGFNHAFRRGEQLSVADAMTFAAEGVERPAERAERADQRLTRRQLEVARLVAEGLSNKEIAERLVIAQRTAEGHVENVLVKTGFKSRAQLAAWVAVQNNAADQTGTVGR